MRQYAQFESYRSQVFECCADFPECTAHFGKLPSYGLEIDIVLEKYAWDLPEMSGVLPHVRVVKLEHVNFVEQNRAVNRPSQIVV